MSTFKIGDSAIISVHAMNDSFEKGTKVRIIDLKNDSALVFNGDQTLWISENWIEPLAPVKQKISPKMELVLGLTVWFVHAFFTFLITLMIPIPWSFRIGLSLIIGHFSAQLSNLVNSKK